MDVVVYTPAENVADEHNYLNELFESGLKYLNIYKPGMNRVEILEWLTGIGEQFRNRMTLHLYKEFIPAKVYGYHVSRQYLKDVTSPLPDLKKSGNKISVSAHSLDEWLQWKDEADTIVISPVFNSFSKAASPGYSLDQWKKLFTDHPTTAKKVALGGIRPENSAKLAEAGFDRMAISGWLWHQDNIKRRVNFLAKHISNA